MSPSIVANAATRYVLAVDSARALLTAIVDDFDGCGADHLLIGARKWLGVDHG